MKVMKKKMVIVLAALLSLGSFILSTNSLAEVAPGVTQDSILVGNLNTFSGPAAIQGIAARDGATLAVEEINASGGIHGRKIELTFADDGCSSSISAAVVKRMIDTPVFGILGGYCSAPAVTVIPLIQKAKLPMLFSGGSTSIIAYPPKKYVFHTMDCGNMKDLSIGEIDYFVKTRKAKRIGIIYQADPFGETILKEQADRLKTYNMHHAVELPFNKGDTDFTSQLVKARDAKLDILYMGAIPTEASIIVRQARQLGLNTFIYGSIGTPGGAFLQAGAEAAVGVYLSYPFADDIDSPSPQYQTFRKKMVDRFGETPGRPNVMNMNGYVGMKVFAEGLKRAGRDVTREKFVAALESLSNYNVGIGFPLTFSPTRRAGCHTAAVFEVVKGTKGPGYKKLNFVIEAPSSVVDVYNKVEE